MASGDIIRIGGGFDRTQYNYFGYSGGGGKEGPVTLVNINGEGYISVLQCRLEGAARIRLTVDGVVIFDVNNTDTTIFPNVGFMTVHEYAGKTLMDGTSRTFSRTLPIIFSGRANTTATEAVLPAEVLFKNSVKLELVSGKCSYEFAGGVK